MFGGETFCLGDGIGWVDTFGFVHLHVGVLSGSRIGSRSGREFALERRFIGECGCDFFVVGGVALVTEQERVKERVERLINQLHLHTKVLQIILHKLNQITDFDAQCVVRFEL